MQSIAIGGYTKKQVIDALHGRRGPRQLRFRYDLLDKNNEFIKTLTTVTSGEVSMNALADIKRTARFSLIDNGEIDWISNRIQPFVEVKMQGSWISFPQGIFLLSSPTRKDETHKVIRDVEAFGGLVILRDDKLETRTIISAGTLYYEAVVNILLSAGITQYNIEYSDAVLQRDIEFEAGKEKLFAINELLRQINYTPIYDDVNGIFVSAPYRSPAVRSAEYTYKNDEMSVTYQGMEEELDLFNVPNKWVVISSNAEQEPLASSYTNDNPDSPTSTVSRGRTIVDFREVSDIADQVTLDAYTQRIAFEASQVYGRISFETALMPFHDYSDVIQVDYSPLGINGKYAETSWSMPLSVGGKMKHEVRRVIQI